MSIEGIQSTPSGILGPLPLEIMVHIFNFLPVEYLVRCNRVCKQWLTTICSVTLLKRKVRILKAKTLARTIVDPYSQSVSLLAIAKKEVTSDKERAKSTFKEAESAVLSTSNINKLDQHVLNMIEIGCAIDLTSAITFVQNVSSSIPESPCVCLAYFCALVKRVGENNLDEGEKIAKAISPPIARDKLLFKLVKLAAPLHLEKAQEITQSIQVLIYKCYAQLELSMIENGNNHEVVQELLEGIKADLRSVQCSEFSQIEKARFFIRFAKMEAKSDPKKAQESLNEAKKILSSLRTEALSSLDFECNKALLKIVLVELSLDLEEARETITRIKNPIYRFKAHSELAKKEATKDLNKAIKTLCSITDPGYQFGAFLQLMKEVAKQDLEKGKTVAEAIPSTFDRILVFVKLMKIEVKTDAVRAQKTADKLKEEARSRLKEPMEKAYILAEVVRVEEKMDQKVASGTHREMEEALKNSPSLTWKRQHLSSLGELYFIAKAISKIVLARALIS